MSDHMKCPMKLGQEDESCDHECAWLTWPVGHGDRARCALAVGAIRGLGIECNTENVSKRRRAS
jgi:hypothetical protein